MSKLNIIPIFVPHMGCPHDCIFCNQRKITNHKETLDREKILNYIEEYLGYFKNKDNIVEIAFYGGSFTAIDRELMISYLEIANSFIKKGLVNGIRLSTRPDNINVEILDILKNFGVTTIELGIQSLNNKVLILNERGHSIECIYKSSKLIKEYGFNLGLQMMIGLYGDDFEKSIFTALEFCKIKPDFVRIYPTLVIKDTYLEKLLEMGRYTPLTMKEAILLSKYLLIIFESNNIDIIRLGLQSSDNISEDGDVVAGPFHDSFRELVESEIYFDLIEEYLLKNDLRNSKLEIECFKSEVSKIAGNKRKNILFFKDSYGIDIKIKSNSIDKNTLLFNGTNIDRRKYILDFYFRKILKENKWD